MPLSPLDLLLSFRFFMLLYGVIQDSPPFYLFFSRYFSLNSISMYSHKVFTTATSQSIVEIAYFSSSHQLFLKGGKTAAHQRCIWGLAKMEGIRLDNS